MSDYKNNETLRSKLEKQDLDTLRKILTLFHDNKKEKSELLDSEKYFGRNKLNKAYYDRLRITSKKRGKDMVSEMKEPEGKAIDCIFMLCEKHKVELEFDNENKIKIIKSEKNGKIIESLSYLPIETSAKELKNNKKVPQHCYLLYYWRKEDKVLNGLAEYQQVVVSYLRLWNQTKEGGDAELIINYSTRKRELKGTFEILKNHVYINLYDDIEADYYPLKINIVIYLSDQNPSLNSSKWFSYNTADRTEKLPNAGIGYLNYYNAGKDWERDLKKKQSEIGIKPEIYYLLYKNRIIAPSDKLNDPFRPPYESIELLEQYEGVYQGINLQNYRKEVITFGMVLRRNGQVVIFTENKRNNPTINSNNRFYEGMCRLMRTSTSTKRMLIIDFDYNEEFKTDLLRFYLVPENGGYLYGVRSGMSDLRPIIGRIKLTKKDIDVNTFKNEDAWKKLDIRSLGFQNDGEIIETLLNEDNTKKFFLGEDKYSDFTDINIFQELIGNSVVQNSLAASDIIKKDEKTNIDIIALAGNYELYSSTLEGQKKMTEYEIPENRVIKFAIEIKKNADVLLKVRKMQNQTEDNIIFGKVEYNDGCLSIIINDTEIIHVLFCIPKPSGEGFAEMKYFYGTLQKMKSGRIESRACVLIKTPEKLLENNNSQKYILEDEEYHRIDKETEGVLSFLRGYINRIIRIPSNNNPIIRPRSGETNLKKELFYAACFKARKKEIVSAKKLLKQAYTNGFGQVKFAGMEIDEIDFETIDCSDELKDSLRKLVIERNEVREEIKSAVIDENGLIVIEEGCLSEASIVVFVKEMWKLN